MCDTRLDNASITELVGSFLAHKKQRFGVLLDLIDARHKHFDYL